MSEHNFGLLNDTQKTALGEIEKQTLSTVDARYSTGYPEYRGACGEVWLYHNGHHARSVGKGALRVARAVGVAPEAARISELAGYAHDIYQGRGHEQRSAAWLEEQLREKGLPKPVAQMASLAIKGTEPIFSSGIITGQMATWQQYPSREAEQVACAVAAADLGTLYQPEGPLMAHDIYRELQHDPAPAIDDKLLHFQRQQLRTLETYRYPTVKAERVLATHRPQVMTYHEKLLGQLERGDVENWQQLRTQDEVFLTQHS